MAQGQIKKASKPVATKKYVYSDATKSKISNLGAPKAV